MGYCPAGGTSANRKCCYHDFVCNDFWLNIMGQKRSRLFQKKVQWCEMINAHFSSQWLYCCGWLVFLTSGYEPSVSPFIASHLLLFPLFCWCSHDLFVLLLSYWLTLCWGLKYKTMNILKVYFMECLGQLGGIGTSWKQIIRDYVRKHTAELQYWRLRILLKLDIFTGTNNYNTLSPADFEFLNKKRND